jgi:hypothetical protein
MSNGDDIQSLDRWNDIAVLLLEPSVPTYAARDTMLELSP